MKKTTLALAAVLLVSGANSADAGNVTIENALKNRPNLSVFYEALVNTGVINELREGQAYTILAPTNDAFAQITQEQYPCFYSVQCREEVKGILRNHIVEGERQLNRRGGMFSIDHRHISIAEPYKQHYTVDGNKVLTTNQLAGGIIYQIDGVIANDNEMLSFWNMKVVPASPQFGQQRVVTEKTYYSSDGRPLGQTKTTTYETRGLSH